MAIIGGDQGKAGESKGSGRKADDLRLSCLCLLLRIRKESLFAGSRITIRSQLGSLEHILKNLQSFFFKEIKELLICFEQTCPRAFCDSPRSCAGTPPAFGKIATMMTMVGGRQF